MGDAPEANGLDDAAAGSAPWERPQDWTPRPAEPTRVDDLLARLSADDEVGRRSRRRAAGDQENTVAASDLIAALQTSEAAESAPAEPEPSVSSQPVPLPVSLPDSTELPTPSESTPTRSGDAEATVPAEATVLIELPASAADDDAEATVAVSTEPTDDADATVLLPRYSEDPGAILASLNRAATGDEPPIEPPSAGGPPATGGPGDQPHRNNRGFLYAGRSLVAVLAALLMVYSGVQYNVLKKTDDGLAKHQVEALDTNDPNIKTPTATGDPTQPGKAGGTTAAQVAKVYAPENILLLGSDTRANGNAGPGVGSESDTDSAQSDTLLIAHISGDRQHVTMVSIPRDLEVDAPLCKNWDYATGKLSDQDWAIQEGEQWKITNAYAVGGPKCTVKAVQQLTGMRIDRVIGIDFVGFKTMVDALGGVQVNVCKPIIDAELHTVIPKAGEQTLVGDQALNFVRARKVQGDPTGDLGRIRRQQVVLSAMLRQVVSAGTLLNPAKLQRFLTAFVDSTYTANVSVDSLIDLARSFGSLDPQKVTFYTLPTVEDPGDSDALALDPKAAAVFDALINDQTLPGEPTVKTSATPKPSTKSDASKTTTKTTRTTAAAPKLTVAPADVDLEVVNVAGRSGVAGEAQSALNAVGFAVTDDDLTLPDDQPVYQDITVLYAPENRAAALTVAAAVPGAILEEQADLGSHVRLLLGTDYTGKVTKVQVGDPVPASLQTSTGSGSTSSPSAGTTAAPTTASTPSTGTAPTLASTDLSSVNAAAAGCA